MALVNSYILFSSDFLILEITLFFSALLNGGACVFIFLFYSMSNDREKVISKHVNNPWERINPHERMKTKRYGAFPIYIIILLAVLAFFFTVDVITLAALLILY